MPHVQFQLVRARGRVGDRERAPLAQPGNLQVHVLAGLEAHGRVQLQAENLDRGREPVRCAITSPAWSLHRQAQRVRVVVDVGLDGGVALQRRAAGQGPCLRRARSPSARRARPRRAPPRPPVTCTLQVAHRPWQQACGSQMPARRQASSMVWSSSTSTVWRGGFDGQRVAHGVRASLCSERRAGQAGLVRRFEAQHGLVAQAVVGQALVPGRA